MQARYLNELVEGCRVDAVFVLQNREMRTARTGEPYLAVELADRTGSLPAVLFRPERSASAIPVGCPVRVAGRVTTFRGTRRISIDRLEPAAEWEQADFLPVGPRSRDEMMQELGVLVRSVQQPKLRNLLTLAFSDKEFMEAFTACPASQSYHHAYLGGLLEHTVAVASLCSTAASRYEGIDVDLLVTAALLHDIGKIDELVFSTGIRHSDEGRLVGHVVSTAMRVRELARRAAVPEGLRVRLEHALLSHHGELEWGSPKRPCTFEALLLHHIDNLDAKAAGFSALLQGAALIEEAWTDSSNLFRRPLYAPRPAEDEREHKRCDDEQYGQRTA